MQLKALPFLFVTTLLLACKPAIQAQSDVQTAHGPTPSQEAAAGAETSREDAPSKPQDGALKEAVIADASPEPSRQGLTGEWAVKWCDKSDPQADCGGFHVYLVQKGNKVCGNYDGALVRLTQIDEGQGKSILGTANGDEATLSAESSRSGNIYRVHVLMQGDTLLWRVVDTEHKGSSDIDVIALDDKLSRKDALSERYLEALKQCSTGNAK